MMLTLYYTQNKGENFQQILEDDVHRRHLLILQS